MLSTISLLEAYIVVNVSVCHFSKLTQGSQLLGLWPGDLANPTGTSIANTEMPHSILLQVGIKSGEIRNLS